MCIRDRSNALPASVKSYVAAVPEPVNCIPLSAADVKPAIAAKSASYACTSLPIANPKFVLAFNSVVAPVPPSLTANVPVMLLAPKLTANLLDSITIPPSDFVSIDIFPVPFT